jgi:hypothetical protein
MNVTPKVGVHLGVHVFNLFRFLPLVKMCFTPEHTFLISYAFAFHTQLQTQN